MPFDFSGYTSKGDMGDASYNPQLGELPSPPRRHSEAELPKEFFEAKNLKAGMTKEVAPTKPSFDFSGYSPKGDTYVEPAQVKEFSKDVKGAISDFFTKPTEDHEFSIKNVLASGGLGSAVGAIGGPGGAALGGGLGLLSGGVGELARAAGAPEGVAIGGELLSGALGGITKEIGSYLTKIPLNWKAYKAIKEAELMKRDYIPPQERVTGAERVAKEKAGLVKKPEYIPVGQRDIQEATQNTLKQRLSQMGVSVKEGETASDATRNTMYEVMNRLNSRGLSFYNSPQMNGVLQEMVAGRELSQLSKDAKTKITAILRSPSSPNKRVREQSNQAINNLIQKGEVWSSTEGKPTKLFDPDGPVGRKLRESFDTYLKNATGDRFSYEGLKSIERTEFQAKALDDISEMVATGFKDIASKDFLQTARNIKEAGPEGKKAFAYALNQHFYDVRPDRIVPEFNRLRGMLKDTGILNTEDINRMQQQMVQLPKDISSLRKKTAMLNILRAGIFGGAMAEAGPGAVKYTEY